MAKKKSAQKEKDKNPPKEFEQPKNSSPEKNDSKGSKVSIIDIPISTTTFIFSHLTMLILGLIFIFGLYLFLNDGKVFPNGANDLLSYQPVTKKPISLSLEIKNPEDELIVSDKNIIVSGSSGSFAAIVILNTQTGENLGFEADSEGEFSKVINLEEGLNELTITAFDKSGNSKSQSRTVYYTEEKLQ